MKFTALLRRGGGFGIYALLPAAVGLISVPILIAKAGAVAFGGVAIAQTIGGLTAIFVGYGWAYLGPASVAVLPVAERPQYFLDALVSRAVVLAILAPVLVILVALFTPGHDSLVVGILMALALVLPGLSGSWYFVGQGRPRDLLTFDLAPNTGATVLGAALLEVGAGLTIYAAVQALGAATAILVTARKVAGESADARFDWRLAPAARRLNNARGRQAAVMALTTGIYINAPLLVVAQFCKPAQIAVYALANKFQKVAVQATAPLTAISQSYVPSATDAPEQRRRMRTAIIGCTGSGLLVGVGFALLAPLVAPAFSSGHLHIRYAISIPLGLSVTMISLSGVVALACLATLGRTADMMRGGVLGLLIGVSTAIWWTSISGPVGVSWSVAAGEGVTALYQTACLWRALRSRRAPGPA